MNPDSYSPILYNAVVFALHQLYYHPPGQLAQQMAAAPQQGLAGCWQLLPQQSPYNPLQPRLLPPALAAMGPFVPQYPQGFHIPALAQQSWFQDFLQATQRVVKEEGNPLEPELSVDDEITLVEAFKKGTEHGLTSLQVFQELNNKNQHSDIEWMKIFVAHVKKLYPKVFPDAVPAPSLVGRPAGSENHPSASEPTGQQPQDASQASASAALTSFTRSKPPYDSGDRAQPTTKAPTEARICSSSTPVAFSSSKIKSERTAGIFYGETWIPPFDGSEKPPYPTRLGEPGTRFTQEEKVFFIHWLHWRLREKGLPDKETLFKELERELPKRTANTWKRFWAENPDAPNAVYIAARKRAERPDATRGSLTSLAELSDANSDEEEQNLREDGRPLIDKGEAKPAATPSSSSESKSKRSPSLPVTDTDLRAMARYKFEKDAVWATSRYKYAPWDDFATRPENARRSLTAWKHIARNPKHGVVIDRYVQEYRSESEGEKPITSKQALPAPPPQTTSAATPSSAVPKQDLEPATLKLPAHMEASSESGPSVTAQTTSRKINVRWAVSDQDVIDLTIGV
ncbi:hypothetical protein BD311DRAFT_759310 [Dichomitus squalens]|uniref:Uncharacterized protein n=1 Tax=Dichomitus squalens TaxID=114155 RepID=A0A4Q9MLR3_9APHY|nr:hypothetical protein BD311DRAFT_759310 [Dichomitus squalens]